MLDFIHTNPISAALIFVGWAGLFYFSFRGSATQSNKRTAKRDVRSLLGILVQGLGIAVAFWGPVHFARPLFDCPVLISAAIVGALVLCALLLFRSARQALGDNWTVVAEVREGGSLVTSGPFAYVRNPIYFAMLLLTIATALGLGHLLNLVMAVPLFLAGTELRIMAEEGLLRERFGAEFDDYVRRVKRIIPFLW
jgi:protein-S-isoprenylcysteine O-methyltransferase Ste14